jgi:UDPglucose 6-dehydrogenase
MLSITSDRHQAIADADVVWVTFDTPVNEEDVADVEFVRTQIEAAFPLLRENTVMVVSSQVTVGFTAALEQAFRAVYPNRQVSFAYIPENLRLGTALDSFRRPERLVVGVGRQEARSRLAELLAPFSRNIQWMSIESAEMVKHAVNAFLATSVAFINEVASVCEQVGADAKEVERGLKSEPRIGPRAYLGPGSAFAGGTLARDISYLLQIGEEKSVSTHLLAAVRQSNNEHQAWPRRTLMKALGDLAGKQVAVLGLTYKPGTDTLRRSEAVELCLWLGAQGAQVRAYDPAISKVPSELSPPIRLCASAREALAGADAMIIATAWPAFKELTADQLATDMRCLIVLDPNRFLVSSVAEDSRLHHYAVGKSA